MEDIGEMPDMTVKSNITKTNPEYIADFYRDKSEIIQYAATQMMEEIKADQDTDLKHLILTKRQIDYLEHLMDDMGDLENMLEISSAEIVIWKRQSKLFANIISIIKEAQAEKLEDEMWRTATTKGNKDNLSKMFLLKARKQEYKDNAPPPPLAAINLRITIDREPIDSLLTAHKPVYDVSDENE